MGACAAALGGRPSGIRVCRRGDLKSLEMSERKGKTKYTGSRRSALRAAAGTGIARDRRSAASLRYNDTNIIRSVQAACLRDLFVKLDRQTLERCKDRTC